MDEVRPGYDVALRTGGYKRPKRRQKKGSHGEPTERSDERKDELRYPRNYTAALACNDQDNNINSDYNPRRWEVPESCMDVHHQRSYGDDYYNHQQYHDDDYFDEGMDARRNVNSGSDEMKLDIMELLAKSRSVFAADSRRQRRLYPEARRSTDCRLQTVREQVPVCLCGVRPDRIDWKPSDLAEDRGCQSGYRRVRSDARRPLSQVVCASEKSTYRCPVHACGLSIGRRWNSGAGKLVERSARAHGCWSACIAPVGVNRQIPRFTCPCVGVFTSRQVRMYYHRLRNGPETGHMKHDACHVTHSFSTWF